ncbi:rpel repeat protein [Grosmannia clavigera kw1407]|uniref:Rpel repeat protein n=1 Tax=Grosmannia clavigera (strain kw1407 / UAMH 11150) TaxID=655863 RepID=F0XJX9_GROCL|nr:rpel repeat protein [Grosmannia clavigera kw1407]EFX01953.1 rpel repeat protein [Grosmannia clavigera kw1407]
MDNENTNKPVVDEAPIHPVTGGDPARRNSLLLHLLNRPNRDELPENILLASNAAPSLQAHQKELEKSMRADSLNEKMAKRPSPEDLIKKGVLDEDPRSPEERYEDAIEEEYAKREGGA